MDHLKIVAPQMKLPNQPKRSKVQNPTSVFRGAPSPLSLSSIPIRLSNPCP